MPSAGAAVLEEAPSPKPTAQPGPRRKRGRSSGRARAWRTARARVSHASARGRGSRSQRRAPFLRAKRRAAQSLPKAPRGSRRQGDGPPDSGAAAHPGGARTRDGPRARQRSRRSAGRSPPQRLRPRPLSTAAQERALADSGRGRGSAARGPPPARRLYGSGGLGSEAAFQLQASDA